MSNTILNEIVGDDEFIALSRQVGISKLAKWPTGDAAVPVGTIAVVLIVREESTPLEEARALQVVNKGLRVICIRLQDFAIISNVAETICTTNVNLRDGTLENAIAGIDDAQTAATGANLPAPKRERNPCK